ncbi:polysaccharide biosynthesis tyrosine autokinase [Xanthobacteraceae bacterium Astr-EGSB]|uniref:polysaccharide biosynthesis tyrosine autokinase n=1 Tax=Astrobacterium formosum TaxID=3069710 RepID=UPI0027B1B16B|nr:polysaccharide biosynthesis tyrosine autokinase [Xanthobacteraceae bacterium Astr-EGSB]
MLQIEKSPPAAPRELPVHDPSPAELLTSFVDLVRRQLPLILVVVACAVALGLVYLVTSPPRFTATGTMVIDTRKVQLFQQQSVLGDIAIDTGTVETQVQILRSENISLAVIKDLRLTEDPEFVGPGGGLVGAAIGFVAGLFGADEEATSEYELTRKALAKFESERTIKRLGLTYAMEISFRSLSPDKAATIANAIADAYIVDQLEAKYQATKRASLWLQDRIKELRTQASAAERAVIDYKEKNNIVDTGGRLIGEQQLAEVNSQLILARASTAEAKARLDRINDILREEIPNESVADALKNETIIKLRGQYVDLAAREANWSERYGRNHLAAINLRNQMQEIRRNISQELARIQQAYQSDYDIARAREESIKNSLANVVSETQLTNQAQVQLRELESNAQSYRAMYDSFLQRYMEAIQQQSFPITEARLISPASRPLKKSDPKAMIILAVSLAGGLVLAFGGAYLREIGDRVFRTSSQVEDVLQVNCLAVVPAIKTPKPKGRRGDVLAAPTDGVSRAVPLMAHVVAEPFSRFAEAVRSLKVAADVNGAIKANAVIGVTSAMPGEGKSTIAANFAQLIAHAGGRVILIDGDLRNPSTTRALVSDARPGLVEVVAGKIPLADALVRDAETGLVFLPAGTTSKLLHTNEILASAAMRRLVDEARAHYDYVVIDFPPLAPVVDVRATTSIVDSYLFVIEWGKTRIDVVEHALSGARGVYERLLGVVLNKADTREIGRYEHYHGHYYYRKHYARYGYVE